MKGKSQETREWLINEAVDLLARGRGQLGIVNMLRLQGLDTQTAKSVSFELFDEAKLRLMKKQRPQWVLAWLLIFGGGLMPIVMFFSGIGYYIVSLAPITGGIALLSKLHNPKRLS